MESLISKRQFLTVSSLFLLSSAFKTSFAADRRATKLYQPFQDHDLGNPEEFGILTLNLDGADHQVLSTPFNVHIIEIAKTDPNRALGANKYGKFFLHLDLRKNEIIKVYEMERGLELTGHISYSENDTYLCATAIDPRRAHQDCVAILDPRSLRLKDIVYLTKRDPAHHDCKFISPSVLATTAGPSIDYVDIGSKTVRENVFPFYDAKAQIRHFAIGAGGRACAQANTIDTREADWKYGRAQILTFENGKKQIIDLKKVEASISEAELLDFTFSQDGGTFGAVHGKIDKVSIWNFNSKKLIRLLDIGGATRVATHPNGLGFVVVATSGLYLIENETYKLTVIKTGSLLKRGCTYSHKSLA